MRGVAQFQPVSAFALAFDYACAVSPVRRTHDPIAPRLPIDDPPRAFTAPTGRLLLLTRRRCIGLAADGAVESCPILRQVSRENNRDMKCLMQSAEVSTKNTFQRLCSPLKALPASYFAPESRLAATLSFCLDHPLSFAQCLGRNAFIPSSPSPTSPKRETLSMAHC